MVFQSKTPANWCLDCMCQATRTLPWDKMVIFLKIVFGPALILCYSLVFSSGRTWRLLAWECQWVRAWLQHREMEHLPPVLSACAGLGLCGGTCGHVLSAEAIKGGVWEHTRPLAPARCLSDLSHYWAASALHSPTAGCVADEALHFSLCLEAVPRPSCCTKGWVWGWRRVLSCHGRSGDGLQEACFGWAVDATHEYKPLSFPAT